MVSLTTHACQLSLPNSSRVGSALSANREATLNLRTVRCGAAHAHNFSIIHGNTAVPCRKYELQGMECLIHSVSDEQRLLHTAYAMNSIANATSECREAFQKYLKEPYPGTESDVARLFVNFERWSASLSVDRDWPSPTLRRTLSLDTLLSTDAMTKSKMTDLLLLIAKHIRQGADSKHLALRWFNNDQLLRYSKRSLG